MCVKSKEVWLHALETVLLSSSQRIDAHHGDGIATNKLMIFSQEHEPQSFLPAAVPGELMFLKALAKSTPLPPDRLCPGSAWQAAQPTPRPMGRRIAAIPTNEGWPFTQSFLSM